MYACVWSWEYSPDSLLAAYSTIGLGLPRFDRLGQQSFLRARARTASSSRAILPAYGLGRTGAPAAGRPDAGAAGVLRCAQMLTAPFAAPTTLASLGATRVALCFTRTESVGQALVACE